MKSKYDKFVYECLWCIRCFCEINIYYDGSLKTKFQTDNQYPWNSKRMRRDSLRINDSLFDSASLFLSNETEKNNIKIDEFNRDIHFYLVLLFLVKVLEKKEIAEVLASLAVKFFECFQFQKDIVTFENLSDDIQRLFSLSKDGVNLSEHIKNPIEKWENSEFGKQVLEDGSEYYGGLVDSKFNGKGIYFLSSGDIYFSDWVNKKKNGYGLLLSGNELSGNESRYIGEFKDDEFHGVGEFVDFRKDFSEFGEWKNHKVTGFGQFSFYSKGKIIYEGWLKKGYRSGPGKFVAFANEEHHIYGLWEKDDELITEFEKNSFQACLLSCKTHLMKRHILRQETLFDNKLDDFKHSAKHAMVLCGTDIDSDYYKSMKIIYDLAESETDFNRFVEKLKNC